jgi:hypothetical protein
VTRQGHIQSRAVILLLLAATHGLALWVIWNVRSPTIAEPESSTSVLFLMRDTSQNATRRVTATASKTANAPANFESLARRKPTRLSPGAPPANRGAGSSKELQVDQEPNTALSSIDWVQEAASAAADSLTRDAELSRQASSLTQWQSHVMPSANTRTAPEFSWDYAQTHRLESSTQGLVINLNDRCSILTSVYLMAVRGGCKLGELPVQGDLLVHMKDDREPREQAHH